MKLLTFLSARSVPRLGVLAPDGRTVIDLAEAAKAVGPGDAACLADMLALLDAGEAGREQVEAILGADPGALPAGAVRAREELQLLAPVPRPRSIRDCMVFERHLIQCTRTVVKWRLPPVAALDRWLEKAWGRGFLRVPRVWHERPVYYKGNPHSVVGHEADVIWPPFTERFDFELEFGVFIGRRGKDIPQHNARQYIAGYALFNDFSARDVQLREMQGRLGPAKGKDFDTGNAIGPYLVTPDEVADNMSLRVRVNEQEWGCGSSGEMQFTFDEIIAYISQSETLWPGDFIGSGTVPGCCGLELDRWLSPGDVVELEADGLGVLRNRVVRA